MIERKNKNKTTRKKSHRGIMKYGIIIKKKREEKKKRKTLNRT